MIRQDLEHLINLCDHVASSDASRHHLNGVMVETSDKSPNMRQMIATDGHILGLIDCESDLEPGFYSRAAVYIYKAALKQRNQAMLELVQPDKAIKYPNWRSFVTSYNREELRDLDKGITAVARYSEIYFNPHLLARLAKGLGVNEKRRSKHAVRLIIKDGLSPVQVETSDENIRGVMMPVRGL